MSTWEDFKALSKYHAEHASMGVLIGEVIAIAVGAILIASILPTALQSFYKVNTGFFVWGGSAAGTNDTAAVAIFQLLPLFAVIGGMALMLLPVVKHLRG